MTLMSDLAFLKLLVLKAAEECVDLENMNSTDPTRKFI